MNWKQYARTPRVAERAARARRAGEKLSKASAKTGRLLSPVTLTGRTVASSFWGKAWCANLESYRDYEYRLPRHGGGENRCLIEAKRGLAEELLGEGGERLLTEMSDAQLLATVALDIQKACDS